MVANGFANQTLRFGLIAAWFRVGVFALFLFGNVVVGSDSAWMSNLKNLPKVSNGVFEDWLVVPSSRPSGLFRTDLPNELVLDNGLLRRSFVLSPNLGSIGLQNLQTKESYLRAVRPECSLVLNGESIEVGGLKGQPIGNFLSNVWLESLVSNPESFNFVGFSSGPIRTRFDWKPRKEWMAESAAWPPKGIEVQFSFSAPESKPLLNGVRVIVHYELYDGLPLLCKWISVENQTEKPVRIESFTSEILAFVEASSQVEDLAEPMFPTLHVETDFTSCSMHGASSQRDAVYWLADPTYATQVNYRLQTKSLLECRPSIGPDIDIPSGESFQSFRTWILSYESRDATRQSLALGQMYRTIAPWVLENPLIHHVRSAKPDAVKLAIDQSAEVGFELVIMTFGSGFNIEDTSNEYMTSMKELSDYAHSKQVAMGGYSLLASRSVSLEDDVVNPATGSPGGFARFGNSPCLGSEWGDRYFEQLYRFYETTNADCLEHDGSYPGDECASSSHPGHRGHTDSRWRQWQKITRFYQWCRAKGIYLNVPDWYFLHGSSKNGMGYRETNWSLPRDYQEIIERQNIVDGTRYKLPTMGWMFVPLTEYHGGGAEATIEPLREHLSHYERRLKNLFGAGVQACFRGPRLYDAPETKEMVSRWVRFYKKHRAILDSSFIPLRRADGRDWDGWIHVNPRCETRALAVVYNPTNSSITTSIDFPLYYSGISESAKYRFLERPTTEEMEWKSILLDRRENARIEVSIPSQDAVFIEFDS